MDQEAKLKNQKDIEKYLEEKKVYDIFEELMKNLIIKKPENPLNFLINYLGEQEKKNIFLVGPPGSYVREYALQLCDHLQYSCLSVGDLLKREVSKKSDLGQQIEQSIKSFRYVEDDIVINVVQKQLSNSEKDKKIILLEGFPKTRCQGLALQKMGIIPNNFIILNLPEDKIVKGCIHKLSNGDGYYSFVKEEDREKLAKNYALEYTLNMNQVKEIYKEKFFQVDAENSKEDVLEDMALLLKYKLKRINMKTAAKILVLGPPGSGRTTLAKALAKKYRMVYISTLQLLTDYIKKSTDKAKKEKDSVLNGELVQDELIIKLVTERLKQKDAQMQGFVLDGFPKTEAQFAALGKINLSHLFILECNDNIVWERLNQRRVDPLTGTFYGNSEEVEDEEVRMRLQVLPNHREAAVSKRLSRWKNLLNEIMQCYLEIILKVNATLTPLNILEKVSFHLENSK